MKEKRLIDANRAMEIVRDQGIAHPNAYYLTNYATLILREAPTVDAVEVVRCKDCAKNGLFTCPMCYIENHELIFINHDPEFFCGSGERKGGNDNGT